MKTENSNNKNEIVIYQSEDGLISFNVTVFEETVWLTQKQIADLFNKDRTVITRHINNIFKEGELLKKGNVQKMHFPNSDKLVTLYNLDVIISVGYRVKSKRGIQFRRWALNILKNYLLNGYAVNENRIKQIELSMDNLVLSHKILQEDVSRIENLLLKLIEKPIIIYNNKPSHSNEALEKKIIYLIDKLVNFIDDNESLKFNLKKIKGDLKKGSNNSGSKTRLLSFFQEIGNDKSDINKSIKGAKIAKEVIQELIKLGNKLKDFL